jgi:hypothetical protein
VLIAIILAMDVPPPQLAVMLVLQPLSSEFKPLPQAFALAILPMGTFKQETTYAKNVPLLFQDAVHAQT